MKIYPDSIGCRLNQAEIERIARQFRAAGNANANHFVTIHSITITLH